MIEAVLHLDVQAPAAARAVVADFLRDRVTPRLVDIAQLIMSELVSNSLRHNAAPHGQAVVVRVALDRGTWRLEVEDPGGGGVLAPDPDRAAAGRLGMNLVAEPQRVLGRGARRRARDAGVGVSCRAGRWRRYERRNGAGGAGA